MDQIVHHCIQCSSTFRDVPWEGGSRGCGICGHHTGPFTLKPEPAEDKSHDAEEVDQEG